MLFSAFKFQVPEKSVLSACALTTRPAIINDRTNNTLYNDAFADLTSSIIELDANNDSSVPAPSHGTRIFNNVFYTKYQIPNVSIESWCLND